MLQGYAREHACEHRGEIQSVECRAHSCSGASLCCRSMHRVLHASNQRAQILAVTARVFLYPVTLKLAIRSPAFKCTGPRPSRPRRARAPRLSLATACYSQERLAHMCRRGFPYQVSRTLGTDCQTAPFRRLPRQLACHKVPLCAGRSDVACTDCHGSLMTFQACLPVTDAAVAWEEEPKVTTWHPARGYRCGPARTKVHTE